MARIRTIHSGKIYECRESVAQIMDMLEKTSGLAPAYIETHIIDKPETWVRWIRVSEIEAIEV